MIAYPVTTALKAAPEHRAETVAFAVYASYGVITEQLASIAGNPATPTAVKKAIVRFYEATRPVMKELPTLARHSATRSRAEPDRKDDEARILERRGVSMLPNQVYAGPAGEIISMTFTERAKAGTLSAVDYGFDVTVDGESRPVRVRVVNEAIDALEAWKNDPANLFRIGHGGSAHELAIDVCAVRILEAIQQGRDLDQLEPVTGSPEPISKAAPSPATHLTIRKYVEQRLYAGYRQCGDALDCAQKFGRVDWLRLKVTQRDLKKIVNDPRGTWKEIVQGQMYLQAEPYLVEKLEREYAEAVAPSAPARFAGLPTGQGHDVIEMFDVALSFAGEQRPYVERVARILESRGVRFYYDDNEQVDMWGKDLYEYLADVFENRARYVVMFISKEYAEKVWPTHERKSAQARAVRERREYILPARFDDTKLPGLLGTVHYINLQRTIPEQLADMIVEKISRGST